MLKSVGLPADWVGMMTMIDPRHFTFTCCRGTLHFVRVGGWWEVRTSEDGAYLAAFPTVPVCRRFALLWADDSVTPDRAATASTCRG